MYVNDLKIILLLSYFIVVEEGGFDSLSRLCYLKYIGVLFSNF